MPGVGKKDRIKKFKHHTNSIIEMVEDQLSRVQIYSGPSFEIGDSEKLGMLIFAYKKRVIDQHRTFLFLADALKPLEIDANTGKEIKVQAPFKNLPSFIIAANVLGYLTYQDEVRRLLHLLSRNCGIRYINTHRHILRKFVVTRPWKNRGVCFLRALILPKPLKSKPIDE